MDDELRESVRQVVIETLRELLDGTLRSEPEYDVDGDEHNLYVFDAEMFVDRVFGEIG